MPEYFDWKPITLPEPDAEAFFHGWKSLHVTPLVPQPDLISNKRPFKDIRQVKQGKPKYEEILPPFGQPGDCFWLPEPFEILEGPSERRSKIGISYGTFLAFYVRYPLDGRKVRRNVMLKFVDSSPDLNRGIVYPGSALPRWLARKLLVLKSHRLERLHDISEAEARVSGIRHVCGGTYYHDYTRKPTKKSPAPKYTLTALHSFKGRWDSLYNKEVQRDYRWDFNPRVYVSTFSLSDCSGRRSDSI